MATTAIQHPRGRSCPECGGDVESTETETVCAECGVVVDDSPIDHGPEWRSFADDEANPERAHPGDENRADKGLGSDLGWSTDDDLQTKRMRRLQGQMSRYERGREYGTTEIQRVAGQLDLPDAVSAQACQLFRDLHDEGLAKGRDYDTVAAAALYAACRINQLGLGVAAIVEYARDVDADTLLNRYKDLKQELGVPIPPPDPRAKIRRIAGALDLETSRVEWATTLYEQIDDVDQCRGSPTTIAAACLYCACGGYRGDLTQKTVADAAGCRPVSIRNRLQDIPGLTHR